MKRSGGSVSADSSTSGSRKFDLGITLADKEVDTWCVVMTVGPGGSGHARCLGAYRTTCARGSFSSTIRGDLGIEEQPAPG